MRQKTEWCGCHHYFEFNREDSRLQIALLGVRVGRALKKQKPSSQLQSRAVRNASMLRNVGASSVGVEYGLVGCQ